MKQEWQNKILVFGFILVLCLPFARMLSDNEQGILTSENRNSASFPRFSIRSVKSLKIVVQYINDIDAYCQDHIGFRSEFLTIFRFCKLSLFAVSPYPDKVVLGTDHWYFLGNSYSDVIKESKGITYFSESQLDLIENNINKIGEDCSQRGIKLYIAIAPNKHTVYGQYLPIIKSKHPTKLEQVLTRMKHHQINIIDLKNDFPHNKDKRLFYLHNTHWNDFGAFLGYRTLMSFIVRDFPGCKVLQLNDFNLDTLIVEGGDLAGMLSLKINEDNVFLKPKYLSNTRQENNKLTISDLYLRNSNNYEFRFVNDDCPLKVLVFRDSFFKAMIPFVKESFGETVFTFTAYDRRLLDIEKPDLIIYEVIERDIDIFINLYP